MTRIIVAHIVKEAKRSPSQIAADSGGPLTAEMKPGIEPTDEGIRFPHFWGKHFEDYNGLGNCCLLVGLSQKYRKPTMRAGACQLRPSRDTFTEPLLFS